MSMCIYLTFSPFRIRGPLSWWITLTTSQCHQRILVGFLKEKLLSLLCRSFSEHERSSSRLPSNLLSFPYSQTGSIQLCLWLDGSNKFTCLSESFCANGQNRLRACNNFLLNFILLCDAYHGCLISILLFKFVMVFIMKLALPLSEDSGADIYAEGKHRGLECTDCALKWKSFPRHSEHSIISSAVLNDLWLICSRCVLRKQINQGKIIPCFSDSEGCCVVTVL